ncbi:MAG TPA: cation transporter [Bacillota bacterium]|nr:heavy metal transporter [Clostridiales bacterium]HPT84368.1 cation transporter [Bacillota bacterium]
MTKTYKLEGLDCPVCASKVERAVKAIDGVAAAKVNFLTGKLTVEYSDDAAGIIQDAVKSAVKKANPSVVVKGS